MRRRFVMLALRIIPREAFRFLPFDSQRFGPPRRFTVWAKYRALYDDAKWHEVFPEMECRYQSPTSDAELHRRLWRDRWPALGVALIPCARVLNSEGFPVGKNDTLIIDLATGIDRPEALVYLTPRSRLNRSKSGTALNLSSCFARENYCHFVLDALPRLELFWRAGFTFNDVDWILLPRFIGAARADFLRALGIPEEKILFLEPRTQYRFERLFQPSFPGLESFVPPWVAEFYRERILKKHGIVQERKLRLYVSRTVRGLLNDAELWARLEPLGFIRVEPKNWDENVRLFASADIIVGPHGAGLANVIFSPVGATLIEIMPGERYFPYFYSAAAAAGLNYRVLQTSPLAPEGTQYRRVLSERPYSVDGDALLRLVNDTIAVNLDRGETHSTR